MFARNVSKRIFILLLSVFLMFSTASCSSDSKHDIGYKQISADEAKALMQQVVDGEGIDLNK